MMPNTQGFTDTTSNASPAMPTPIAAPANAFVTRRNSAVPVPRARGSHARQRESPNTSRSNAVTPLPRRATKIARSPRPEPISTPTATHSVITVMSAVAATAE